MGILLPTQPVEDRANELIEELITRRSLAGDFVAVEIHPKMVDEIIKVMQDYREELDESRLNEQHSEDTAYEAHEKVAEYKRRLSSMKGRITRLKARIEKIESKK